MSINSPGSQLISTSPDVPSAVSRKGQKEATLSELFGQSLMLMDGGLGTTLEDQLGSVVSQSALWSAHPIASNNQAIIEAHLAFLRAGARIISTSSYQCSFETFSQAGFDAEEAKHLMLDSVRLAVTAIFRYQEDAAPSKNHRPVYIALSLGPFGATLKPTQEFGGFYPPPYGPRSLVEGDVNASNTFGPDEGERERIAIEKLAQFHLHRLAVFASDVRVWQSIDCIAFETIPLRREVKAIRKAIGWLKGKFERENIGQALKPWWISCIFPNGMSPEDKYPGGPKVRIEEMVEAAFNEDNSDNVFPSGFGINCTPVMYAEDLGTKVGDLLKKFERVQNGDRAWLILYPNGNDIYNELTQSWQGLQEGKENEWAEEVGAIVVALASKQFGGIVVGGCCRTGSKEIIALDRCLTTYENTQERQTNPSLLRS